MIKTGHSSLNSRHLRRHHGPNPGRPPSTLLALIALLAHSFPPNGNPVIASTISLRANAS
jgi:hypothetical protein